MLIFGYVCRKTHPKYIAKHYSTSVSNLSLKQWRPVIGLEIHAQIASKSKLFSGAGTKFGAPINHQVSIFDASIPGTLPVINKRCVEAGVLTALALKSNINMISKFDRKHYFYADLPTGYQITQQSLPLAVGGYLDYMVHISGTPKVNQHRARITQIQLEQDSGKSLHDAEDKQSLIDLNRAGVGLLEVVTEPDFHSSLEAAGFVKEFQLILKILGASTANMSEGALRVDASISVHKEGEPLGTRTEVKNINSIKFVKKAIDYEIHRQISLLESNQTIENETRNYDDELNKTVRMRDKEKLHDYRFLPEPNLPPLYLYNNDTIGDADTMSHRYGDRSSKGQLINIDLIKQSLPLLPSQRRLEVMERYGLSRLQAYVLINEEGLLGLFDTIHQNSKCDRKFVINFLLNDFLGLLNQFDITYTESALTSTQFIELLEMLEEEEITRSTAIKVLELLLNSSNRHQSCAELIREKDWFRITDKKKLEKLCRRIIERNPKKAKKYLEGKKRALNHLMGELNRETEGAFDGRTAKEVYGEILGELKEKEEK